jgi:tripeptidyl-peptidase-1
VLHEKRDHVPAGWSRSGKHHATAVLPLRFGLSQPNIDAIDQYINDVAHPDSPNYGNHWTPAEVAEKFAPTPETIQTVKNWLMNSGFAEARIHLTNTKSWIELNATVEEAERLLNAEYYVYTHSTGKKHVCKWIESFGDFLFASNRVISACNSYHLPAHVSPHVDLVTPTVHFNAIVSRGSEPAHVEVRAPASTIKLGTPGHGFHGPKFKTAGSVPGLRNQLQQCDSMTTPECLRALYGIVYKPPINRKNSYAIG